MRNLICILLIFTDLIAKAQGTYSISGIVKDDKGQPVAAATVFLTNSTKKTSTNEKGEFLIMQVSSGSYEMVVNMLGFTPYSQNIIIQQKSAEFVIELQTDIVALNEVVIKAAPDPNRPKYMGLFRRYFIGESANARQCVLLNPEVLNLHFDKEKQVLEVSSRELLTIENKALGYRIKYLLHDFKLEQNTHILTVNYKGLPYFEELEGTKSQQKQWDLNRRNAYEGSLMHFFRAAFSNSVEQEGFLIYKLNKQDLNTPTDSLVKAELQPVKTNSIVSGTTEDFRSVKFEDPLVVIYTREKEPTGFFNSGNHITLGPTIVFPPKVSAVKSQISVLNPISNNFIVDRNGATSPESVMTKGYWSWEIIGDLLPLDYVSVPAGDSLLTESKGVQDIIAAIDTFRNRMPVEKLYVQTDKPYYFPGDTLWFKTYLFDAALSATERSGLLYIELANDTGKVLQRRMLPLAYGLGYGNIVLSKEGIPEGSYTLRAYTNWMQNFGENYVFKKNFYIGSLSAQSWLISAQALSSRDSVRLGLQFSLPDRGAVGLRDLQLRLMEGKKNLFRSQVQTSADGKLDVSFALPPKTDSQNITLLAQDLRKGGEKNIVYIPVSINRPENTDLQFMPEGGSLVAGINTTVGFKAIGEDGKGTDVTGKVYSSTNKAAAVFASSHKGMGSFDFTPISGEQYTAKILLQDGTSKSYPLPQVKTSGTSLRVNNPAGDSVSVTVSITPDLLTATAPYYLVAQSRGVVCYAKEISFTSQTVRISIPKVKFPTGITHFTLLSSAKQPLCERIIFINHQDHLNIKVRATRTKYNPRSSITLQIEVVDASGKGIEGSFSVAVTDDNQVKADSTGTTIMNYLLLSSELKGTIEEPAYYFQTEDSIVPKNLDNLLLTQGWVGYSQNVPGTPRAVHEPIAIGWKDIFSPVRPVPKFDAEPEFMVKGRAYNAFNKGVANTGVILIPERSVRVIDTTTDAGGRFTFRGLAPPDSTLFMIQAKNRNGKSFNIGVEADEFKPMVFEAHKEHFQPWYLNTDTTLLRQIRTKIIYEEEIKKLSGSNMLKEVVITGKKAIEGSWNLNGPGEADQVLDEKDLFHAGKLTILQLMEQKVKGFKRVYSRGGFSYMVNSRPVIFIADGFLPPYAPPFNINYYEPEDIKGIEVMSSPKYTFNYSNAAGSSSVVYIEITTRAGTGGYTRKKPGVYVYYPVMSAGRQEFYSPRYTVKDTLLKGIDVRSTIHWAPNVITNESGRAAFEFYAADKPGTYTIMVEGTDLQGKVGYLRKKIVISSP